MALSIQVQHSTGELFVVENLTNYQITETASPLTPADTSGGATTVQVGVGEHEDSAMLSGGQLTVFDGSSSLVHGEIDTPASDGTTVSITSYSVLARLNTVRKVPPYTGTLAGYITTLLAAAGVTRGLSVDGAVSARAVVAVGFNDNVLSRLKEFVAAQGVEMSDRGDAIYVRLPRTRFVDADNISTTNTSTDRSSMAQRIEVMNYNSAWKTNELVYPPASFDSDTGLLTPAGWNTDTPTLTVDAGAVTVVEVPIVGSLGSVEQPTCVKEVGPTDGAAGSVYTVIGQGSDSGTGSIETLDPDAWTSRGGSVTVAIGDNYDTLVITIKSGWNEPSLAPFAIAMSSGDNTTYSTLRIRGTGVIEKPQKLAYSTGLGPDDTTTEVGVTVDSHAVLNRDMAERVASETVTAYSHPITTISGTIGNTGLDVGDIAGARFQYGDAFYRITQAVTGGAGTQVTAVGDTTISDFDAIWATRSFDDFDAEWSARTDFQFAAAPLRDS